MYYYYYIIEAKDRLLNRLKQLLKITSDLPIRPQFKLSILRKYIYSNLVDDLKKYSFGATWIRQNLDSECYSHVRSWLGLPISACLKETLAISKLKCGFAMPSIEHISEKLRLKKRYRLIEEQQQSRVSSDMAGHHPPEC